MADTRVAHPPGATARVLTFAGALLFAASIGYFIWFYLAGLANRAPRLPAAAAATLNAMLFIAFGLHHSIFARAPWRAWVARTVSPHLERTAYVWIASAAFVLVCMWWSPFGAPIWDATPPARHVLRGLQAAGVVFTLWAARALDALSLAGIRQLEHPLPPGGIERATGALKHSGPYGVVRHPIYLGWLLIVWAAPTMTSAHLEFAALSTGYLIVATFYEERSLRQTFGPAYDEYARRVPRKMVPWIY